MVRAFDDPAVQDRLHALLTQLVETLGSQGDTAKVLNAKQPQVSLWLNRDRNVPANVVPALAAATHTSIDELLGAKPSTDDSTGTMTELCQHPLYWSELEPGARAMAAEKNRTFPEWAWEATAHAGIKFTGDPDPAGVYELVKLHFERGWGRPHPETGSQLAATGTGSKK